MRAQKRKDDADIPFSRLFILFFLSVVVFPQWHFTDESASWRVGFCLCPLKSVICKH